jgi:excisionase family DNA binding protein
MESSLLRVKEAAQILKVSTWTIYRWIDESQLQATKIGRGSLRIFRDSVDRLVEANRTQRWETFDRRPRRVVPLDSVRLGKR